ATLLNYKFLSNEYRTTGICLPVNLCQEAKADRFGVIKTLQKSVNIKLACPVKK
ncbi:hypothetical protein ILUMI_15353, partial [Ignelater luminosus]